MSVSTASDRRNLYISLCLCLDPLWKRTGGLSRRTFEGGNDARTRATHRAGAATVREDLSESSSTEIRPESATFLAPYGGREDLERDERTATDRPEKIFGTARDVATTYPVSRSIDR